MHFSFPATAAAVLFMAGTTLATPFAAPSGPSSGIILGTILTDAEASTINAKLVASGPSPDEPLVFTAVEDSENSSEKRSYMGSCSGCFIYTESNGQWDLLCTCRNQAGNWMNSAVSLNACLANNNGQLVWARYGGFQGSCRNKALQSQKMFKAECRNNAGVWAWTGEINLEQRIHNYNGQLGCDATGLP